MKKLNNATADRAYREAANVAAPIADALQVQNVPAADLTHPHHASEISSVLAEDVQPRHAIAAAIFPPRVVLFAALFAWYLWAIVDLRLVFQTRDMLFLWNLRYFTDFIGQPGSLLVWMDKLLVQWCYHGWPAAMAIAAAAWLMSISTIGLMNALGRARIGGAWVIPGVLLISLYGSYLFPTSALIGLTLAMTAANAWCRMPACRASLRLTLFIAVSVVLYYVAGEAYYCFAACCAIEEGLMKKRWFSSILFLLAGVAVKFGLDAMLDQIFLASHHFFVFTLSKRQPAPLDWRLIALYLYFPACALFAAVRQPAIALANSLWQRLRKSWVQVSLPKFGARAQGNRKQIAPAVRRSLWTKPAVRWAGTAALVLLFAAVGFASLDRRLKLSQEIDYCAEHQLWNDVLAKAEKLSPEAYSYYVTHDVNLALFHTGHLADRMFAYPQRYPIPMLFIPEQIGPHDIRLLYKPFGLLLDLGRVCEAERLAIEMAETWPTGAAMKRLAWTKLIKDQPADARVVLNVMRDDLVWGRWAEEYLRRINDDPSLADDEDIQRMRGLMIRKDDLHLTNGLVFGIGNDISPCDMLVNLLKQNPENRMAFEYLMATCLCSHDLQTAVQTLVFLDGLPYPATPPHFEEALLIHLFTHPREAVASGSVIMHRGRIVSQTTMDKFRRLKEISARHGGLDEKAEADMARELGDSYFYYYFYSSRKPL